MKLWVCIKIKEVLTTGEVFLEMCQTNVWVEDMQDEFDEILVFDSDRCSVLGYNTNTNRSFSIEKLQRSLGNG